MSDPWEPLARGGLIVLDPTSKPRAGLLMWRIAILAGFMLNPCFTHQKSWQESVSILKLTFAFQGDAQCAVRDLTP